MTRTPAYDVGLERNPANFVPLSPLSFIERSASVFPQHPALVYAQHRQSWAQTYERCRRLGSALAARGIGRGDTVAAMLPNVPAMFEAHFGVPMCGAVLNTLNTRLDAETIAFMLRHGGALPSDLVAIQGIGGLGHLGIQFAKKFGYRVAAIGRGPNHRTAGLFSDGERHHARPHWSCQCRETR